MRLYALTVSFLAISMVAAGQQAPPPVDGSQDAGGPPDEPGRSVARLSVLSGDASVRRGDSGDWVAAALNAPLMVGDSVSVAAGGATELQFDAASFARLAGDSEIRISEFEGGRQELQLAKGLVTYRVLRQTNSQAEINTALAAIHPLGLASVRVEVEPDGSTRVLVRHGDVEVSTRRGVERVHEGNMMLIKGSADDPEFQIVNAPPSDQWDNWSDQRDSYLLRAQSPRYVSQDMYGTEDMDNYGRWNNDPAYGDVWTPTVPATWAPYRDGRWVWEDYYGWTWIDASPWGWAPFHYGSWYNRAGFGWSWFPGRRFDRCFYRPALVGFFGFGGGGGYGFGFGFGNIGWIPLAPYERFHPWYGRGGWGGRNTVVNNINIVRNTNITNVYRNARISNGVTAVSGADFQRGNFRNQVAVGGTQLQQASLVRGAVPVTPGGDHLRFSDRTQSTGGPRVDTASQRFYSRTPSVSVGSSSGLSSGSQRVPFAQQQNAVRSAFESRGVSAGLPSPGSGANPGDTGRRFGSASGPVSSGSSSAPGWQRFGNPQGPGGRNGTGFGTQSRALEVAPPIVRERQSSPYNNGSYSGGSNRGYNAPSYNQQQQNSQPAYRAPSGNGGFGAPGYRPSQSYPSQTRSSPSAPAYRSAPAPRTNSGGGGGNGGGNGGGGGGGGGGHVGGGNSGGHGGRR